MGPPATPLRLGSSLALIAALLLATGIGYLLFGKSLSFGSGIVVADYSGMTQAQAQQAVVNAGLRTRFTKSASETVPPDHVIRQSPSAGIKVEKNQVIELVISNGKPLRGLDDVRGYSVNDAQSTLQQEGFAVTLVRRYDNTLPNTVIDQSPKPGAKVPEGIRIALTVSNGPAPVIIPNFVGMPVEQAKNRASRLGITLDTSQTVTGTPPDTVASQSVAPGTRLDRNAIVRLVVNAASASGPLAAPPGNGPAVNLRQTSSAKTMLQPARSPTQSGFQIAVRYAQQSTNNGTIVGQTPPAGAQPQGTTVTITLSVSGEVPDTGGKPPVDALKTLEAYGYAVSRWEYTTTVGAGGKVVGTVPGAGTALPPESSVTVTVNGTPPP